MEENSKKQPESPHVPAPAPRSRKVIFLALAVLVGGIIGGWVSWFGPEAVQEWMSSQRDALEKRIIVATASWRDPSTPTSEDAAQRNPADSDSSAPPAQEALDPNAPAGAGAPLPASDAGPGGVESATTGEDRARLQHGSQTARLGSALPSGATSGSRSDEAVSGALPESVRGDTRTSQQAKLSPSAAEKVPAPAAPVCYAASLELKNVKRLPNMSQHRVVLDASPEMASALDQADRMCVSLDGKRVPVQASSTSKGKTSTREFSFALDEDFASQWTDDLALQVHACSGASCATACPSEQHPAWVAMSSVTKSASGRQLASADAPESDLIQDWKNLEKEVHPAALWKLSKSGAWNTEPCGAAKVASLGAERRQDVSQSHRKKK